MFKFALNQTVYFMNNNRVQKDTVICRYYGDYSDHEKAQKRNGGYAGASDIKYSLLGYTDTVKEANLFSSETDLFVFLGNNILDKGI